MSNLPTPALRPAQAADAAALTRLLHETFHDTWLPNLRPQAAQAWLREEQAARYVAESGAAFIVATIGGELAGFVHRHADFIHALHVSGRFRRHGIGQTLLAQAEQAMLDEGHTLSRLETDTFNTASRAFYIACGYREVAQYPDEEWDSGLTTVLLTRPLEQAAP